MEEEVGPVYQEVKHVIGKFTDCVDNNHVLTIYCLVLISLLAKTPCEYSGGLSLRLKVEGASVKEGRSRPSCLI